MADSENRNMMKSVKRILEYSVLLFRVKWKAKCISVALLGVSLLLAGCNAKDPYNNQQVGGGIKGVDTSNPLKLSEPATQVVLLANRPVSGLAYSCDGVEDTNSTIKYVSQKSTNGNATSVGNLPVARCANDAHSITFYLGDVIKHVTLGTIYLPIFTKDAKGDSRFTAPSLNNPKGSTSSSSFIFSFSIADMQKSPARLNIKGAFDSSGKCKPGHENACQVIYKAALLQALDTTPNTDDDLTVPICANQVASGTSASSGQNSCASLALSSIPDDFDYSSYNDFTTHWQPYLQAVTVNLGAVFPSRHDVIASIAQGASRLRAGRYQTEWSTLAYSYYLYYQSCYVSKLSQFDSHWLVYPDGTLTAFGAIASNDDADKADCSPDKSMFKTGFMFAGAQGGSNQPHIDKALRLDNVAFESISPGAKLNMFGRFFGAMLYDGRIPTQTTSTRNDFEQNYPETSSVANADYKLTPYAVTDSEKGSITGQVFQVHLPGYAPGKKIGYDAASGKPTPFPMRASKVSTVQARPLDQTVLDELPDFYNIQLMRYCTQADSPGSCHGIPASDFVDTQGNTTHDGNYVHEKCLRYQLDNNGNAVTDKNGFPVCKHKVTITAETPRKNFPQGTNPNGTSVDLYFDKTTNGKAIIWLYNASCKKTRRVGFVQATPTSPDVNADTANVTLLFTASDRLSIDDVPQLGVSIGGRMDLSDPARPLYRLGDNNFKAGTRAKWVDTAQYRLTQYLQNKGKSLHELSGSALEFAYSLSSGAVVGEKATSPCTVAQMH